MRTPPHRRPRAQLPGLSLGERAFVALCVVAGLIIAGVMIWAVATGRAPWWLVLIG